MDQTDTARFADMFAALGSKPRLEIVRLLLAAHPDGMIVADIQAELDIPNSPLSHHLEKLRMEDLVESRKDSNGFGTPQMLRRSRIYSGSYIPSAALVAA